MDQLIQWLVCWMIGPSFILRERERERNRERERERERGHANRKKGRYNELYCMSYKERNLEGQRSKT